VDTDYVISHICGAAGHHLKDPLPKMDPDL